MTPSTRALDQLRRLQARHVRNETARRSLQASPPALRMPDRTPERSRELLDATFDMDLHFARRILELVHGC